jgi:hypothetical protein
MQREAGGVTHSTGSGCALPGTPRGTQGSACLISNSPGVLVVNLGSVWSSPSAHRKQECFLGNDDAYSPMHPSMGETSTSWMDEEEEERLREQEQFAMTMLLLRNRVDLQGLSSRLPGKE